MAQMTIEQYRKKHKRCRTCVHAYDIPGLYAKCKAKNITLNNPLPYCGFRGMFCKIYQPKGVD